MVYITLPQSPIYHQVTLEELLSGKTNVGLVRSNETNTRTYCTEKDGHLLYREEAVPDMINSLVGFVEKYKHLYEVPRQSLYRKFHIPKHSGGLREINAPNEELDTALRELRTILETKCNASYHTSAFAYMKGRCTVDAVKKHQQNNSRWFLKVDFHDFFGSTTKEFVLSTLEHICPFNLIGQYSIGREALEKAIDLCFLNGGLPQGTPISPMLTNLVMIPVDFRITRALEDSGQQFVYTRYADDMLISSFTGFKSEDIQNIIRGVLRDCNAPYTFKPEKTRYGSRAGSNWNLGVMLNKDNEITVGHKVKKQFRAMIHSYVMDKKNNKSWEVNDVQTLAGLLSYYKMIEEEYFTKLIEGLSVKYSYDITASIKADLSL